MYRFRLQDGDLALMKLSDYVIKYIADCGVTNAFLADQSYCRPCAPGSLLLNCRRQREEGQAALRVREPDRVCLCAVLVELRGIRGRQRVRRHRASSSGCRVAALERSERRTFVLFYVGKLRDLLDN